MTSGAIYAGFPTRSGRSRLGVLGNTEVGQFHLPARRNENVVRAHVAVNNAKTGSRGAPKPWA